MTSTTKHTPGPWLYQKGFLTVFAFSDGDAGSTNAIASICRKGKDQGSDVDPVVEAEANARLIAAAPELLYALRQIANQGPREEETEFRYAVDLARAAIAKA